MADFFEKYNAAEQKRNEERKKDEGESNFLSSAEKQVLIDEGIGFPVLEVKRVKTQYGDRWVVGIELEGESKLLGFGAGGPVKSRDRMMEALVGHLANGGEPPVVKIVLNGRSQVLVDAEQED